MFLNPNLLRPPVVPSGSSAQRTADHPTIRRMIPPLGPRLQRASFKLDRVCTFDKVPLQIYAYIAWHEVSERPQMLTRLDSRLLLIRLAKTELAEQLARTMLGALLLNLTAMDKAFIDALRPCASDLPVRVNTAQLLGISIPAELEAANDVRCLQALRQKQVPT